MALARGAPVAAAGKGSATARVAGFRECVRIMAKAPEQEDLNTSLIAVSGLIGAIVVFVGIVALQAWYYHAEKDELYRKIVAPAPKSCPA